MKLTRVNPRFRILLAFVLLCYLTGCAEIRTVTYPTHFTWLGKAEVKTVMAHFSDSVARIDRAAERQNPVDKALIIKELDKMIDVAESLMADRQIENNDALLTNHLLIDEHIDDFLGDLTEAKWQLENTLDGYYLVGNLTGNCTGCHQYR